jgi:choline dehydrogenase-like flavoprotein
MRSTPAEPRGDVFDAVVIGTGFGGAVTACRLVQAGFRICVLERGRRYGPFDFPKFPAAELFEDGSNTEQFAPPPDFSRWLWDRDQGIYEISDLDDVVSVQAAGYGGGSLIYANVHLRPPRTIFADGWPREYFGEHDAWPLAPYYDLAAYMLDVSPIPTRLAKTIQLKRAAAKMNSETHWFRAPLAINFVDGPDRFGRVRQACDMRARCDIGCDVQAKNTLDLNYLAQAEAGAATPDIRTLAEVDCIARENGMFVVRYKDGFVRDDETAEDPNARSRDAEDPDAEDPDAAKPRVYAPYVFLCAGALNTTELLMRNAHRLNVKTPSLGSHYFPNADSLGAVFHCDQPHEADFGPTITSALLFNHPESGPFRCSVDFIDGLRLPGCRPPRAGAIVCGGTSGAHARLMHDPLLDWGSWDGGAAGTLIVEQVADGDRSFQAGERLTIGGVALATARTATIEHEHWFLLEDGGYPPDTEPLTGIFKSPLWLRRNRYVEGEKEPLAAALRRASTRLRVSAFGASAAGTAKSGLDNQSFFDRAFDPSGFRTSLLADQIMQLFPNWLLDALANDKNEIVGRAGALALPMLGRLLDDVARTAATQIDADTISRLGLTTVSSSVKREVLIRGLLRQALQVVAGSEDAVADKIAKGLADPVPNTPLKLLELVGDLVLWALAYGAATGHTGIVLTLGRDLYRSRLRIVEDTHEPNGRLLATLPSRVLDTTSAMQERVLRTIASTAWNGELRTNPAWSVLDKRLTVHSQGGCPMGRDAASSVTNAWGEVHECPGLFIMDAAAFPRSVGVNPSASIAAIAELKIERFIRRHRGEAWSAEEKSAAVEWAKRRQDDLDPLNRRQLAQSPLPRMETLGMTLQEVLRGVVGPTNRPVDFNNLDQFPSAVSRFTQIEADPRTTTIVETRLRLTTDDLARLTSGDAAVLPMKLTVTGSVTLTATVDGIPHATTYPDTSGSFELFVRPPTDTKPPTRFFRYELTFGAGSVLRGLKVLRDAPGADAWTDTSTLYVDITRDGRHQHGVIRVGVEDFLRGELPSINITGTKDTARKTWALVAFDKYFATALAEVYMKRRETYKDLVGKLFTTVHV